MRELFDGLQSLNVWQWFGLIVLAWVVRGGSLIRWRGGMKVQQRGTSNELKVDD